MGKNGVQGDEIQVCRGLIKPVKTRMEVKISIEARIKNTKLTPKNQTRTVYSTPQQQ